MKPLSALGALLASLAPVPVLSASLQAERPTLTAPLYLEKEPPACRSLRVLRLAFDVEGGEGGLERARERAVELRATALGGTPFRELVKRHSQSPDASRGGVLGTFPPGVLARPFDAFLFGAALDEISPPIEGDGAVYLLQRVERYVGCRQILIRGKDERASQRVEELVRRLGEGADFAELARTSSDEPESAARGGAWRIFERGSRDTLLKAAAFDAAPGEVFGPLSTPFGFHLGLRVAPESLPPELRESNWARARVVVLDGPGPGIDRSPEEAKALAREIHQLATDRGEGLRELAERHSDDAESRARGGDIGWVYRPSPTRDRALDPLFHLDVGEVTEPRPFEGGWVLMERTE